MPFHVLARGFFGLLFIRRRVAGGGQQRLIVITHVGADHYLELASIGEAAFHHRQLLDGFGIRFGRVV